MRENWLICSFVSIVMLASPGRSEAIVIAPFVDTFTSQNPLGLNRFAVHTVNGTGLSGIGAAGDTHNAGSDGVVWTTAGNLGPVPATDFDPEITYDLGGLVDLNTMRIWNVNSAGVTQLDVATMEVFAGPTTGSMVSKGVFALNQATGLATYSGQDVSVSFDGVRFVRFDIKTSHDGAVFDGTGAVPGVDGRSLSGLSEVRFEGTPTVDSDLLVAAFVHQVSSELVGFGRQAVNSVNSSGLSGIGETGDTHITTAGGTMWTTTGNGSAGGTPDLDPEIVYDLGGITSVKGMRIWNYNEGLVGRLFGPDLVNVLTSVDGINFDDQGNFNFAVASGLATDAGQEILVDFENVRYIKFDILTNHDGAVFDGTGSTPGGDGRSLTGLSEVRFVVFTPTAPEPSSLALVTLGLFVVGLARRRGERG